MSGSEAIAAKFMVVECDGFQGVLILLDRCLRGMSRRYRPAA